MKRIADCGIAGIALLIGITSGFDSPWKRVNHPLLFDHQGKPKPAFDAVVKALSP